MAKTSVVIAVDTGGTFTDAVALVDGRLRVHKAPSTPEDPSIAIARAVEALSGGRVVDLLIHGTTVATNALLERAGAETWLIATDGHQDVLELARQRRPALFAAAPQEPPPLVPSHRTLGVPGRRLANGDVRLPLALGPLRARLRALDDTPRSWAVCLLHSYACPTDELRVAELLREIRPNDWWALSSNILPLFREYERAATTCASAFVAPIMSAYLRRLTPLAATVHVMSSSGGRLAVEAAAASPASTALSGPAGGVVAASQFAVVGGPGVLGFDMGGTSTDVAVCRTHQTLRHEVEIGGIPIHLPTVDLHTIGAGGGSIAWVDDGGALRVGPQSAGATPGPACYGAGFAATVTDANVVLGRLPADARIAGNITLDAARAEQAVGSLAVSLDVTTAHAAAGILKIATAAMSHALRYVTVHRGVDPRELPLVCFGGAGGLHACDLADEVGCPEVWVPHHAGVFSAIGLLLGPEIAERSQTVLGMNTAALVTTRERLRGCVLAQLGGSVTLQESIEMRYSGQSFTLEVRLEAHTAADAFVQCAEVFEAQHETRFGFRVEADVVPVTLRARAEVPAPAARADAVRRERSAISAQLPVVGPMVLALDTTTIWVADGWTAIDGGECIRLLRCSSTEAKR